MSRVLNSIHPDDDAHYKELGLTRNKIEIWEDGMRTDGSKSTYEWWYFDSHFPDGTIMVVIFYSKSPIDVDGTINPHAIIELNLPDGRKFTETVTATIEESYYATDKCDVKIGDSRFTGDLKHYDIVFNGKDVQAKISLDATIPAWRAKTGSIFFGDEEEHYFAWLPAVPEGKVVADVNCQGMQLHLEGSGYHDHNWGNISMMKLMHHWYWGRAKIGDYKVISSWITSEEKYGYKDFDIFMLAKGNEILGDNSNHTLKFLPTDEYIDEHTGKPVYNKITYEYETPAGEQYRVIYNRRGDISKQNFIDLLSGPKKLGAKLIGFDGSYLRFEGSATIEKLENGKVVESVTEESAVWELMYFGKSGTDKKANK